jgi:ubiquinone/menaquinone biosynthesis C-methylase UbiE
MNHSPKTDPIALFRSSWTTYQKIVKHNYMFHEELFQASQELIKTIRKPLSILDLGCGDAALSKTLLAHSEIKQYIACDLSENALDLAKHNLASWGTVCKFYCIDMLEQLRRMPDQSLDLIFSSYAIHHLNDDDKSILFSECQRTLNSKGYFVCIDVMRNEMQERDIYINQYLQAVNLQWPAMSEEERQRISDHVRANDFPLCPTQYAALAHHAGLRHLHCLDAHGFHQAWAYQKLS